MCGSPNEPDKNDVMNRHSNQMHITLLQHFISGRNADRSNQSESRMVPSEQQQPKTWAKHPCLELVMCKCRNKLCERITHLSLQPHDGPGSLEELLPRCSAATDWHEPVFETKCPPCRLDSIVPALEMRAGIAGLRLLGLLRRNDPAAAMAPLQIVLIQATGGRGRSTRHDGTTPCLRLGGWSAKHRLLSDCPSRRSTGTTRTCLGGLDGSERKCERGITSTEFSGGHHPKKGGRINKSHQQLLMNKNAKVQS